MLRHEQKIHQLFKGIIFRTDVVMKIRTVKAREKNGRVFKAQVFNDVLTDTRRRRRGQRDNTGRWKIIPQIL